MILHCYNEGKTHFDNNDDWWSQNLIQSYFETTSYMKNYEGEMSEIKIRKTLFLFQKKFEFVSRNRNGDLLHSPRV